MTCADAYSERRTQREPAPFPSKACPQMQDALGDKLCVALDDASVVEILLNPDGRLFIERLGHGLVAEAGAMAPARRGSRHSGSVAHRAYSHGGDDERRSFRANFRSVAIDLKGCFHQSSLGLAFTIRRRASRLIRTRRLCNHECDDRGPGFGHSAAQ